MTHKLHSLVYNYLLIVFGFGLLVGCSDQSTPPVRVTDKSDSKKQKKISDDDYFDATTLRYEDFIYRPFIRTVTCHKVGFELNPPIYRLGGEEGEGIQLRFDDMEADDKDYQYTIIQCGANWEPGSLAENEYMEGFFTNRFTERGFSRNTLIPYTHYELTIPNRDIKITKSGNYLLVVYLTDKEEPVITRRFMIVEDRLRIESRVRPSSVVSERFERQEVDFTIYTTNLAVNNPLSDLQVVLMQNNRWDNAVTNLSPTFIRDNELVYDLNDANIFDGGNEFRAFDVKSLRYNSTSVQRITEDSTYQVHLYQDQIKTTQAYSTQPDINGKYVIRNDQGFTPNLDAEYVNVHFSLKMAAPVENGNVYIFGQLSDWKYLPEYRMDYNLNTQTYEQDLLLKQGYYNYVYMTSNDSLNTAQVGPTEGNHFATENDYTVLVYFRGPTDRHDRLVGIHNRKSIQ